jgi:hypothetical protein
MHPRDACTPPEAVLCCDTRASQLRPRARAYESYWRPPAGQPGAFPSETMHDASRTSWSPPPHPPEGNGLVSAWHAYPNPQVKQEAAETRLLPSRFDYVRTHNDNAGYIIRVNVITTARMHDETGKLSRAMRLIIPIAHFP